MEKNKAKKKKTPKKVSKKYPVLRKNKKKLKNSNPDVIFDSAIGETGALFVSLSDTEKETKPIITPLDPEIDQAIKELDFLENTQKPQNIQPQINQQLDNQPVFKENLVEPKKSFWRKLSFFKNKKL